MDFLKELNKEQLEAVLEIERPVLILAGAGSGKTRVITYKIAYLIKNNIAKPENIVALTFTNKAADEMKHRVRNIIGYDHNVTISTFHSLCAKILRNHVDRIGYDRNFNILDENPG